MKGIIYFLLIATLIGCSQEEACLDADLVLYNSKIYTADSNNSVVESVAVKDGSEVNMDKINFLENSVQVSAYKKNLQYGDGGKVYITNSNFVK